jgi:hypothetical protein
MWDQYKRTFLVVQLAAAWVAYVVYRDTHPAWVPTAVFVVLAQASAVLGAMWAAHRRRKLQS